MGRSCIVCTLQANKGLNTLLQSSIRSFSQLILVSDVTECEACHLRPVARGMVNFLTKRGMKSLPSYKWFITSHSLYRVELLCRSSPTLILRRISNNLEPQAVGTSVIRFTQYDVYPCKTPYHAMTMYSVEVILEHGIGLDTPLGKTKSQWKAKYVLEPSIYTLDTENDSTTYYRTISNK